MSSINKTETTLPEGCVYNECTIEVVRYVDQETFFKNGQHDAFIGRGKTPKEAYWDAMEKLNAKR